MRWLVGVAIALVAIPVYVFGVAPLLASLGRPVSSADMPTSWPFTADRGRAGCEYGVIGDAVWFQPDGDAARYPMNVSALLQRDMNTGDYKYGGRTLDVLAGPLQPESASAFYQLVCGRLYLSGVFGEVVAQAVNSNDRG